MNIREVSNALNEIRAKMSCPEDLMVDTIKDDKVIFENVRVKPYKAECIRATATPLKGANH